MSELCPNDAVCRGNRDCLSRKCVKDRCLGGGPVVTPDSPTNTTITPNSTLTEKWAYASIADISGFGDIEKDAYGAENRAYVQDPAGGSSTVLKVKYPAKSVNPSKNPIGGTGFYAKPLDLTKATEVTLDYKVFFPTGFNFVKGGKLPGLYGGRPACSGGDAALDCFSTRYMFRTSGAGELYAYVEKNTQSADLCKLPPSSICSSTYGISVARGSWYFETGKWTYLSQTITLNTPGQQNGKMVVRVNGIQVISFDKVNWRNQASVGFVGIDFATFFGGSDSSWATPTEQFTYFKDFSLSVK